MNIPLNKILPNPEQPRKEFDKTELQNLADSIREHGVIQPVSVEEAGKGMYILHDGERRVRAARLAGLEEIKADVMPGLNGTGKADRLMRAMVANVQRADLNPIEESDAYHRMADELGLSQIEISRKLGLSYARVCQRMDLGDLDKPIRKLIEARRLTADHRLCKALKEIPDAAARIKMAITLADRNVGIKASLEACQRLIGSLSAEKIGPNEVPAIKLAVKKGGPVNRPLWDVFAQAGKVPPYLLVEISARTVCERCGLRDMASATTCRGCALVEMLVQMVGRTK